MKKSSTMLSVIAYFIFNCTPSAAVNTSPVDYGNITEDDILSCYTLIQNQKNWEKAKLRETLIEPASYPYICPNLPYKIYIGNAYNWKKSGKPKTNFHYLCIKDLTHKNRYNFILLTPENMDMLNNNNLGSDTCGRLSFILSTPQWIQFAD